MHIEGLDELDNKILEIIRDDARLSYSEIGERAGVSRVCVKNRMAALEQKGIIKGYRTVIDEEAALDTGVSFILDAEIWHQHFEAALAAFAAEKSIRKLYITSGDDHIHGIGFTTNRKNLSAMVNRLYRTETVRRISSQVILSTIKDVDGGVDYALRYQESEHMEGPAGQKVPGPQPLQNDLE